MKLETFNGMDRHQAVDFLKPCLDIARWAEAIICARPFDDLRSLLSRATLADGDFTEAELRTAIAHHPKIGEKARAGTAEAEMSDAEQAGLDRSETVAVALARGNRAYEAKFGRIFLIRAAGRSSQEILDALETRLNNTSREEDFIVAQQLREIAALRISMLINA